MLQKHFVAIGIMIAIILLVMATFYYPGGSQADKNSIGYSWTNNYFSNLFTEKAVNGADNTSRPWAVAGMFFLSTAFAVFFYRTSKKMPEKAAANVVKYVGIGSMVCAFLIATPLHDLMVRISGTGALIAIFYVTVFVFRSKLFFLKILSVICLLFFYTCSFMYYSSSFLEWLPVMQKLLFIIEAAWMLCIEYFTTAADFIAKKKQQPAA